MKDQLECTRVLERTKHINVEDTRTRLALAGFKSILGILVFVLLLLPGFSQVQPETVGQTVYSVCSGNTLLGYNGPVSSLNSQGGNTGAIVVPIALGQTINGNIDKSDYFYPTAGGGIWQDEYQLVLHQDTKIALELHAPNGGYTRTLLYCDHATLPNGDKGTYSAFSGGNLVGNNIYRRPAAGFGDLSLGSNIYFPGLYRIVVFSDTPGPYTLKVLSPVAGTHINFTVENGNANAPQPVISDSNGHWTRDFDPASTYRITAEKAGYSVSPSSQVFDGPSDELDFELFSLASIPEITYLTLNKNTGVAGEIQTVNATIHATGAVDGTPVSICLLNAQGSNPLAPLFYPSPGDLDNKDLKKFWENLKEDPYQEITYKSIAGNGTIINGQATVTMVIPDKLAPGYYQVRAQLAGSASIMSKNYNIATATDVPLISSISLTPAQHNTGQSQYIDVSVETYNVKNGTSVTATLVNNDGSPLATPVDSVTGVISDNQVQLGLYLPSGVPAGHYSVKVTISLAEILTGFKPYHIVNYPDAEAVDAAIEALTWESIKGGNTSPDNITTNLKSPLPTTGPNGTSISWSANPVDWINTTTGAVTRPTTGQGHQTIVLTATISKGMFSGIKNFTLTIIDPTMVVTPSASLASGTYGGTQNITLSTASEGATIYYTTDNSKPTTASTPYTNMIEVAYNMTIKAIAIKEGMENSPVSTFEYVIFAGGDGSIDNPYQVATAEQLNNVRYHLDKHFQQTADIDLSSYYTGSGWEPIGSDGSPFTSIFNGNGKIISNLTINRSTENYTGLFGFTGTTAKIRNVKLENNNVIGQQNTGALVGYNQGTIFNSYATGNVTSTDDCVGGLIGCNQQNSSITDSYAIGNVVGGQCTGGLVGYNQGTITRSYATGEITGRGKVAGLVGSNSSGTITNSYATGAATGTENYVGGLVGWTYCGTITNAYSTGAVTGTGGVGGLVGWYDSKFSAPYVTNSYWDINTSGITSSAGGNGKTTADMTGGNYGAHIYFQWNFGGIWKYGGNNGYPSLINNPPVGPDKTLISIITPSAITGVANGTAKEAAALGLPDKVRMITDRGNVQADVTWYVDACSYEPAVTTEQTFTVNGTVTLPTGVINPGNKPLTTTIRVTVKAQAGTVTNITAVSNVEVAYGTAQAAALAALAATTTITDSNNNTHTVSLSWSIASYDSNTAGNYTATGTFTLPTGVDQSDPQTELKVTAIVTVKTQGVEPNPTITGITSVSNVEVAYGTAEAIALAALAATTTITDSNNNTHTVSLSWSIASYDSNNAGNYTATGTFTLPAGVDQSDPQTELKITATVRVNAAVSTDKTLVSITAPSAITGIANGTANTAEALGLPTKVTLITNDGNVQANVTWYVAACSYDPAVTTRQTFTVNGNVTLPAGVVNPNSVELRTSISVTVNTAASPPPPWYPVSGVTLNKSSLTLEVNGPAQKLAATVQPSYASYPYVYWNSSDTAVARVDNTGLVTPVAPGQAIITATTAEGGKTASCTVTVMATITATAEETIVLHDVPVSISIPPEVEATIEVTPGSTMPQVNINNSTALGIVEIQIPEGTIASGPDGWDGTFKLPTISSQPSVNINGASQVNTVIVLGLEDEQISFSQAVRILIPGQAQQQVGYIRNGVFTPITRILSADRQDVADSEIPADGDGKIDVDSNLAVWTKHFTEFVIYTPISNPKPASYTVSLSSNYTKAGTVSGDGTFYGGSLITVRAKAQSGYVFDYWSENGSMLSRNSVYSFNLGESSRQLQANFVREFQELSITDATKPRIITFSHPVLPDEQNLGNIYVATDINGDNKVEGVIVAGVPGNNCQISVKPPDGQWLSGASYYLILEPGLQSALNKTLGIRTRMKFTVE